MAGYNSFEEFEVWQKARIVTRKIYSVSGSAKFAKDYSLRDQIRRASISIMANIAEGFFRDGNQEFVQFLSIAKASAGELKSHLYIAFDQEYVSKEDFNALQQETDVIIRQLGGLIKYLKKSNKKGIKYTKS
jgi:four helix bundle protein